MRFLPLLATLALVPGFSTAQTTPAQAPVAAPAPADTTWMQAAKTITADDIRRHVEVIAHDSMMGRDTPSRGLTNTAQYLVDEFAKLGLKPLGDRVQIMDTNGQFKQIEVPNGAGGTYTTMAEDTSWYQRYPLPGNLKINYAATQLALLAKLRKGEKQIVNEEGWTIDRSTNVDFLTGARFAVDTVPQSGAKGTWESMAPPRVSVLSGPHTIATVKQANLRDRVVVYIPAPDADAASRQQIFNQLYAYNHVLILSDEDSASFVQRQQSAMERPVLVVDRHMEEAMGVRHWASYVRPDAVDEFLDAAAGLDLAKIRAETTPQVRDAAALTVYFNPQMDEAVKDTTKALNVIGYLPGSNPKFGIKGNDGWKWEEFIVVMAHMDGRGITSGKPDSINNGANDNASGVAGLLSLAKALSQPGARPRRSVLFVATSGGTKEFWGAANWAAANAGQFAIANTITLDMIGRKGDSVMVDGLDDQMSAARVDWIMAQHPDLGLRLVNGGTIATPRSDHFELVRRALPGLLFYTDEHDPAAAAGDSAATVDAEVAARVMKLVFYTVRQYGDLEIKPMWTGAGRRNRVKALGQ